ncbi:Uncharacterized protein SAPIO_CDS7843 [Scedosporium apiospermum]|uniref:tRNA(Ile)-lysidine synthetase n=1 Tax=Pseudallescheria apiosperma TaxID=563466 RepID=A0A084G0T3_PSEDA|nr:Uncharacterized protein SAPIO_CDS7843 [Scedosporium apiospermum]KEZ40945.1 Uncharacterized protein SAPIO_CDS7843 [Scedosporium apiospermum]
MAMRPIPRIFHHSAKPVSVQEFVDALRAACPPRYPKARHTGHRRIGVATSGGVDSMALAFLFSALRKHDPDFIIGDNPCGGIDAFVIDHKLRDSSTQESHAVLRELEKLRYIKPQRLALDWAELLGSPDIDPRTLPNLETAARRGRYRTLGGMCVKEGIDNLFLAHHADDQHETVLMRLLGGHPGRGLVGIRSSGDIPECNGIYRVHQSGFIDLMRRKKPPLTYKLRKKEVHDLRRSLLSEISSHLKFGLEHTLQQLDVRPHSGPPLLPEDYFSEVGVADDLATEHQISPRVKPDLPQLDVEDGGVRICRPLLDFEKDRLIATCEQNGVKWFEDHTNTDPTLTTRNAVRYMVRNFELPQALQRPAILQMADRLKEAIRADEEEADGLFRKTEIIDFRTNSGTLIVQLPEVEASAGDGLEKRRTAAALLVRRLIEVVTPEEQFPMLPSLRGIVSRLFPRLATEAFPAADPPKPFNIGGVLFSPLLTNPPPSQDDGDDAAAAAAASSAAPTPAPPCWFISRAPYKSTEPLPSLEFVQRKGMPQRGTLIRCKPDWSFVTKKWHLWDGRFWIRPRLRLAGTFAIEPFRPSHAKTFRNALEPKERERLEALLRTYAPGKVRYTLPAIYYKGSIDWATMTARIGDGETLLALPSLGVQLPRLGEIVEYQVRYKKVGEDVLRKCDMSFVV